MARGIPFMVLGSHELAYLVYKVSNSDLAVAQGITILTIFLLAATKIRKILYLSIIVCVSFFANSPDRLFFIRDLGLAVIGISFARKVVTLLTGVVNIDSSSIVYFVFRANIGYPGLETDTEKILYELPLLVFHYVWIYRA